MLRLHPHRPVCTNALRASSSGDTHHPRLVAGFGQARPRRHRRPAREYQPAMLATAIRIVRDEPVASCAAAGLARYSSSAATSSDLLPGRLGDVVESAERTADGRDRHTGGASDVFDRDVELPVSAMRSVWPTRVAPTNNPAEHRRPTNRDSLVPRNGTWRSSVAHLLWEQGVAGSNPVVPTKRWAYGRRHALADSPARFIDLPVHRRHRGFAGPRSPGRSATAVNARRHDRHASATRSPRCSPATGSSTTGRRRRMALVSRRPRARAYRGVRRVRSPEPVRRS